jgi:hypothetical protein
MLYNEPRKSGLGGLSIEVDIATFGTGPSGL